MMRTILFFLLLSGVALSAGSGPAERAYRKGDLEKAKQIYNEILAKQPGDMKARYNLGNVEFRAEELEKAEEAYLASLRSTDPDLRSDAAHNLGNIRFLSGDLDGAINAYQDALRAQPGSADSRYNLELAMRMKEMAPPQQQQQQQQQQDGEEGEEQQEENQQQQQEQQQGEDEQQEPQQQEQEQQPQPQEEEENQEKAQAQQEEEQEEEINPVPPPSPLDYSEEEAERVLDGLAEEERELLAERMRAQGRSLKVEKDW